jgi:hypothetical protein
MVYKVYWLSSVQRALPVVTAIALFVLAGRQPVTSSVSQTTSQATAPEIRKVLIHGSSKMPEQSTVAITAIRNLQGGEHWLRDLEIEVQNNFSKPIYHLEIDLRFPEIVIGAGAAIIPLMFGRYELVDPGNYAAATEKSIRPGEKYVFKIPEPNRKALESYLAKSNMSVSAITKVTLRIYELSFGDGTGFEMGEPFPISNHRINRSWIQETRRRQT